MNEAKKYNKWMIILIVLWVVAHVPNPLLTNVLMARFYTPESVGRIAVHESFLIALRGLLRAAIAVGVAVWLYRMAKRDGATPWLWCMMGLFFSVLGAVLYLLIQIYERHPRQLICRQCQYDLRGALMKGQVACPECGHPVPQEWQLTGQSS